MRLRDDVPTPALLLDLESFEANVAKMSAYLKNRGLGFRPHGKTHKCPTIARALIAAGAIGCCAAKLSEAEVFAAHGIGGLLVTTPVVGREKVGRAVRLAMQRRDTIFAVESDQNVRDLDLAAAAANAQPALVVRVAIDLYFGRTGCTPGPPALALAQLIDSLPHVTLAGIQAFHGTAAHTHGFEARRARTRETMGQAVETRRLIEKSGIACPMLSGGSTGTYNMDAELDGVTELQPGSFIFMDSDYRRIGGADGGSDYTDFRTALTVVTTVISKREKSAIVDAGFKAFSTDRPFRPEPVDLPGVAYDWAGDEHGRLDLTQAPRPINVKDRIEFVAPHCDPTVNLYERIYALRGDRVEAVWSISARGMSQ